MIVTIVSGKGGAGKTTVAASLLSVWDGPCLGVDLDVEEPNLHLLLGPQGLTAERATLPVPAVDASRCTRCGACVALCRFKALALLGDSLVAFPDMCHGCGGCFAVCPENALRQEARELGTVEAGWIETRPIGKEQSFSTRQPFLMGRLRVGEAMSPPLLRAVKRRMTAALRETGGDAIVDGPPGVSCPAMCAARDSDLLLLVAEPTAFGLHDFSLAVEAFRPLDVPMAVVVNRTGVGSGPGEEGVRRECARWGLPVLAEIPFSRSLAEHCARNSQGAGASQDAGNSQGAGNFHGAGGGLAADHSPALRALFEGLRARLRARLREGLQAMGRRDHA